MFGWALLIAGAIALLLPVVPGVPLLMAGAAVLGPEHPVVRTWKARIDGWRNKGDKNRNRPNTGRPPTVAKMGVPDLKAAAASSRRKSNWRGACTYLRRSEEILSSTRRTRK
jgi:hypothetical protein